MNEFHNQLIIKEEPYKNGMFTEIPNYKKRGSAFVLADGVNDDIVIAENTSSKQIRKGKYTRLIEISTLPYMKEIRINSMSKENAYFFEVYIKAVIQVKNPIRFYENSNLDVDAYFENLFSMDVRKITRKYSILDYQGMDEELAQKLSSFNTEDEATGFEYRISVVDAVPGETAQEYVKRVSDQHMEAEIKKQARGLTENYTNDYEQAIMTEVAEGKRSEADAIAEMEEYKARTSQESLKIMEDYLKKGLLTETQVKEKVTQELNMQIEEKPREADTKMHAFYEGEDIE